MARITRRDFLKLTGGASAAGLFGLSEMAHAAKHNNMGAHVVVVGGGFGGATCAKYLKRAGVNVTLVEPSTKFITCPFSNYVIGGMQKIDTITHSYEGLKKHGVNVVHDTVTDIHATRKSVKLKGGKTLKYDRLVVSPGIDFKWDTIKGYSENAASVMPHAWKAGPQTLLLRKQLENMKDGGTFIMVAPPNPFRCPPGPYERASMVANYFKQHKPKSKVLILDPKEAFSKQGLFQDGWKKLYGNMIEWVPGKSGGKVLSVNTKTMTVEAELAKHKGAVVNVIPAQTAGAIAIKAGLANESGFCPVDFKTFESKIYKGIHVIGDSSVVGPDLPKSGFAANSEAKMCAAAIASMLKGESVTDVSFVNTCYSLVGPTYGISVVGVYRVTEKGIVPVEGSGGVSPKEATDAFRADEAKYAYGWYASITADTWG